MPMFERAVFKLRQPIFEQALQSKMYDYTLPTFVPDEVLSTFHL